MAHPVLLDPVHPSVEQPIALAWIAGRNVLLATTGTGELVCIKPSGSVRTVTSMLGVCPSLAVHADGNRWLTVSNAGQWQVGTLEGEVLQTGRHRFRTHLLGFFTADRLVLVGDDARGTRRLVVIEGGHRVTDVSLPPRVHAHPLENNGVILTYVHQAGLSQCTLQEYTAGVRFPFPDPPQTDHQLRRVGDHLLGITSGGVAVWHAEHPHRARTLRVLDIAAGDISRDGEVLALGTRNGAVMLARVADLGKGRPDSVRAFDGPVTSVAFSPTAQRLATGAACLRLWSWGATEAA